MMTTSRDTRQLGTEITAPKNSRGGAETDPKRLRRLLDISRDAPSKLAVFRRAFSSLSLRASVNAFCLDCMGLDVGAIRDCSATACPLWNVRPYRARLGSPKAADATAAVQ
jgi:hypothetical protein